MSRLNQLKRILRKGGSTSGVTAVEYRAEGIALAHLEVRFGQANVSQCVFLPGEKASDGRGELKHIVGSLGLSGGQCTLVLSPSEYRLLTVEAPDVPAEELRDALRWSIHESLDYPIEQAAVDSFPIPEGVARGVANPVFAVAANRALVGPLVKDLAACGLNVSCIDIAHLALRNLAERSAGENGAVALLALADKQSQLIIVKNGSLYLARPIGFSSRILDRQGGEREIAISQLVGELKRSLDYFEVQLRQDPISSLEILPSDGETGELVQTLSENLATEVREVRISQIVPCDAALSDSIQHHSANVIGGALNSLGGF